LAKAKSSDGQPGYMQVLLAEGSVLNPLRNINNHAFILLVLVTVYSLDRDSAVLAEINSLMGVIDLDLRMADTSRVYPPLCRAEKTSDAHVRSQDGGVGCHP
jgi:mannose-6-phosphate isomerase